MNQPRDQLKTGWAVPWSFCCRVQSSGSCVDLCVSSGFLGLRTASPSGLGRLAGAAGFSVPIHVAQAACLAPTVPPFVGHIGGTEEMYVGVEPVRDFEMSGHGPGAGPKMAPVVASWWAAVGKLSPRRQHLKKGLVEWLRSIDRDLKHGVDFNPIVGCFGARGVCRGEPSGCQMENLSGDPTQDSPQS